MLRSLCARPSFCAFSGRRSQISLAVAYPGSRPQSTCTGSIPGLDAVIPFSLYQQLQEKNEQLHEKLAREMKEMLRSQAEGRDKLSEMLRFQDERCYTYGERPRKAGKSTAKAMS